MIEIDWFGDGGEDFNPFAFLSNFYAGRPIWIDGASYKTAEHAYQAYKTDNDGWYAAICAAPTASAAKKVAKEAPLRADWDMVKYDVMRLVVNAKFTLEREEGIWLVELTGDALLTEGTYWNDECWGVQIKPKAPREQWWGRNWLGTLLMARRAELRAMKAGAVAPRIREVQDFATYIKPVERKPKPNYGKSKARPRPQQAALWSGGGYANGSYTGWAPQPTTPKPSLTEKSTPALPATVEKVEKPDADEFPIMELTDMPMSEARKALEPFTAAEIKDFLNRVAKMRAENTNGTEEEIAEAEVEMDFVEEVLTERLEELERATWNTDAWDGTFKGEESPTRKSLGSMTDAEFAEYMHTQWPDAEGKDEAADDAVSGAQAAADDGR